MKRQQIKSSKWGQELFVCIVGILLFTIAVPLLLAARDKADVLVLNSRDHLIPLTERQLLYVASGVEFMLSAMLLIPIKESFKFYFASLMAFNLLIGYTTLSAYGNSVGILANLTNRLPISPSLYDQFTFIILSCLLIGSIIVLIMNWRLRDNDSSTSVRQSKGQKRMERNTVLAD